MALEKFSLTRKVAIVTGAGRGLGRQMALALATAGADVVCAARTQEQIDRTVADITALGRRAVAQSTDVRDSAQCDALVRRAVDEFGRLDIMLSNAGIGDMRGANAELWDVDDADWRDTLDVNLSSAFYCARAASKQMVAQGGGGVIINVASGTALRAYPMSFGYGAAKAGVIALTKSLSAMLVKHGIRVNCIIPGFVQQAPARNEQARTFAQTRGRYIPAQRLGEAWELGPLAVFLASDASSYVTGQGFVIDGGGLAGGLAPTGFAPEVPL
ncbi:MAG TPA: SDR family NAD(P)-dependent oxidoreductase [Dehalococcoidia bacterium]|nr:SDR family NAD(P)-dependent oxidoreductase [Dehalococcoidia bacterium]